jgi:ubiquinone/menaquinone biosynthesis C-methylase UbiE
MTADADRAGHADANVDRDVVEGFGREWSTFRQGEDELSPALRQAAFDDYFAVFPWERLPPDGGSGVDVGCGSGRWAALVVPRVAHLHLMDVSPQALAVARDNLASAPNVSFHLAGVSEIPLADGSQDFAYSLGVLHHVPDTKRAITDIARKLKPGAPLLLYLYYAFDNRPAWFRAVWSVSNAVRRVVSHMPPALQLIVSSIIATFIYWPLARIARLIEMAGLSPTVLPLAWYRDKSFYVMRTDAYDRFCTRLEQRFTRREIENMLTETGFGDIRFSDREPFWCVAAVKLEAFR